MRRRYHRAATRIQKVFRGHKGRHRFAAIKSKIMASMKPKTPQGKGVLNSVKTWFGPAAEPAPAPTPAPAEEDNDPRKAMLKQLMLKRGGGGGGEGAAAAAGGHRKPASAGPGGGPGQPSSNRLTTI